MKHTMICAMVFVLISCGTKINKPITDVIAETNSYIDKVNDNESVSKTTSTGVLTDASGFKDKGSYTLSIYHDKMDHELYRIENIESTDNTITENFYFKENELVYMSTQTNKNNPVKLFLYKGKVINETNVDSEYQKILLNKANLFKKEFKKEH